jgi:hypothetical protein
MTTADMTTADSLAVWLRVRREADWHGAPALRPGPSARDGFRAWCAGPVHQRDPARAERLLRAHDRAGADAERRAPLDFALLAGWQCEVLGVARAPFRTGDAHAKGGRERYGLTVRTRDDFAACLREAADQDVPLAGRAARAYLDVAFFHPFDDGNAAPDDALRRRPRGRRRPGRPHRRARPPPPRTGRRPPVSNGRPPTPPAPTLVQTY